MKTLKINWWEIGDKQNLHLDSKELDFIKNIIEKKYRSLNSFGKKLSIGRVLYSIMKYKNQGIKVILLKQILVDLNIPIENIGKYPIEVGQYKLVNASFPIELNPSLGELFAHSLFDGYADDYVMRYSNYDEEIREEFCLCVKDVFNEATIPINRPNNFRRDIDLPVFIPRFLKSFLLIYTFHSNVCRVSEKFIKLVEEENLFGWYFLKGAYLDEGTASKDEVLIVTGMNNRMLVEDCQKISGILDLSTRIRTKKGYYELALKASSLERFYENISNLFFTNVNKWKKISERVQKRKKYIEIIDKVKEDCKRIIEACQRNDGLTLNEIEEICNLSESTAYFRTHLLIFNGNLEKIRDGRWNKYFLKNKDISNLSNMNNMRRAFGWR